MQYFQTFDSERWKTMVVGMFIYLKSIIANRTCNPGVGSRSTPPFSSPARRATSLPSECFVR